MTYNAKANPTYSGKGITGLRFGPAVSKPAPVNIDLGSAINLEINDIIGDKDANDLGSVQEGSSLSEEYINKINEEVEENTEELLKNNCLKGNE